MSPRVASGGIHDWSKTGYDSCPSHEALCKCKWVLVGASWPAESAASLGSIELHEVCVHRSVEDAWMALVQCALHVADDVSAFAPHRSLASVTLLRRLRRSWHLPRALSWRRRIHTTEWQLGCGGWLTRRHLVQAIQPLRNRAPRPRAEPSNRSRHIRRAFISPRVADPPSRPMCREAPGCRLRRRCQHGEIRRVLRRALAIEPYRSANCGVCRSLIGPPPCSSLCG
jgi:hypothetical protein